MVGVEVADGIALWLGLMVGVEVTDGIACWLGLMVGVEVADGIALGLGLIIGFEFAGRDCIVVGSKCFNPSIPSLPICTIYGICTIYALSFFIRFLLVFGLCGWRLRPEQRLYGAGGRPLCVLRARVGGFQGLHVG
jgi:hypothetical protein